MKSLQVRGLFLFFKNIYIPTFYRSWMLVCVWRCLVIFICSFYQSMDGLLRYLCYPKCSLSQYWIIAPWLGLGEKDLAVHMQAINYAGKSWFFYSQQTVCVSEIMFSFLKQGLRHFWKLYFVARIFKIAQHSQMFFSLC